MKIKIGNKIHSGDDEPIMVILTERDKANIYTMNSNNSKYCVHPDGMPKEKVAEFMGVVIKDITQTS